MIRKKSAMVVRTAEKMVIDLCFRMSAAARLPQNRKRMKLIMPKPRCSIGRVISTNRIRYFKNMACYFLICVSVQPAN